jgi:hypothetical protein
MRPLWREFAVILLAIVCWVFFAVSTYGCTSSEEDAKSAADCRAKLAEINAGCAARKLACQGDGCEDRIEKECDVLIDKEPCE